MSEELDLKDELELSDELEVELDEDIGSDLDDLLTDDTAELNSVTLEEETSAASDEGLDELDAFLDDFEKNLDIADSDSDATDDEVLAAEMAADLDMASGDEEPQVANAEDESPVDLDAAVEFDEEPASEPSMEKSLEDDLEAELSAVSIDEEVDEELAGEVAEPIADEELKIDESDLDLDVGLGEEATPEETIAEEAVDESADLEQPGFDEMLEEASEEEAAPAEMELEEPAVAEAAAATVAAAAAATTSAAVVTPPPAAAPAISKPLLIGGGLLITTSILLSLAALWMGMGLNTQIDTLNQNVSQLQQRVIAQSRRGTISPQAQLGEQLNLLGERVNELAVIIEGPMAHLQESNRTALQELGERIGTLEKSPPPAKAVAAPVADKSLARKPQPVAKKKGGWVINLLSVASTKTASSELARLKKMGVSADRKEVNKGGKTWYRLRVTGYESYKEAKSAIKALEQKTGFSSSWVGKE